MAEVSGLPAEPLAALAAGDPGREEWTEILCVVALPEGWDSPEPLPCLLGSWSAEGQRLRFRPRFPPAPGLTLVARFDGAAFDRRARGSGTPSRVRRHAIPDLAREPTTAVAALHPAGDRLPSNLLRLYLVFTAPMSARGVLPHVRLIDVARGEPVAEAFVEVEGGLWDPQRTRLTLLVHPGRVKRGVGPRTALGPVLEEGRSYRLEVGAEARDADGLPLRSAFARTFQAGPPDHRPPAPESWRVRTPPTAEAALVLELAEPADQALLERLLTVVDAAGLPLAGRAEAAAGGKRWSFRPAAAWRPGRYEVVVPAELEDPSGNRPGRRFEEPGSARTAPAEPVRLAFEVR